MTAEQAVDTLKLDLPKMKKIGRYIVRGLLGRGGMAKVYKVELPIIGKIAALKHFDPDPLVEQLMGSNSLQSLFVNEAVTMAGLQHPNIVEIHDFDEDRGKPFYVMDFFANNLGTMMGESYLVEKPSRRLYPDKALKYTRQTLKGLACLHHAGIVHRDIKPYNLLVTAQDIIKICDFGLSKLRAEPFRGPANLNVGSPYYAAPEQEIEPNGSDARADVFPVGITLYRMLTGYFPVLENMEHVYRPCGQWNSDLDDRWDTVIRRAVAPNPIERYASASDMLDAVNSLAAHWQRHKQNSCQLPIELSSTPVETELDQPTPRCRPMKVRPKLALQQFGLDTLWRPQNYTHSQFEAMPDGTVTDHATGLLWQQSGCRYPGSLQKAASYIADLNARRYANRTNWRLPTIDELMTLLRPIPNASDLCVAPVFDARQRWIWSIDRRSFTAAYFVDVELGFIGWQDFSAPYFTRAVCSMNQQNT